MVFVAAKLVALHRSGYGPGADVNVSVIHPCHVPAEVDHNAARFFRVRKTEFRDSGMDGCGQLDPDPRRQLHGVIPRLCNLVFGFVNRLIRLQTLWWGDLQSTEDWEDRNISIDAATGPAQMRKAKATRRRAFIAVERTVRPVGIPIKHPERPDRSGQRVAVVLDPTGRGPDKWVDLRSQIASGLCASCDTKE